MIIGDGRALETDSSADGFTLTLGREYVDRRLRRPKRLAVLRPIDAHDSAWRNQLAAAHVEAGNDIRAHPREDPVALRRQGVARRPGEVSSGLGNETLAIAVVPPSRFHRFKRRPLDRLRPIVEVVRGDLRAIRDDHLIANNDGVISQQSVWRDWRHWKAGGSAAARRSRRLDRFKINAPLLRANVDRAGNHPCTLWRAGKCRPTTVRGFRHRQTIVLERGLQSLQERPVAPREPTLSFGKTLLKLIQVFDGGREGRDRGPAENFLGGYPRNVDRGVGMNEHAGVARSVGYHEAIVRERFLEPAVLVSKVTKPLGGVVSPRTGEGLFHDASQRIAITIPHPLVEPSLGLGIDAIAIDRASLGR